MSDFPVANRRKARKLGLLRSKSSEAERERQKPAHTVGEKGWLHGLLLVEGATQAPATAAAGAYERVCGEMSDADAPPWMLV